MHVLHVTAHLGGGVGKAHAALMAVMAQEISHTYLLLEEPRDRRYVDEIAAGGVEMRVASGLDDVARHIADADIVQFEYWNHPRLYECLARTAFPPMRAIFWSHISGLFEPLIAPGLMETAERFVFTSPASMMLGVGLAADARARLSVIGSGFGFETLRAVSAIPPSAPDAPEKESPICYLGTVDFIKMNPLFFEVIDQLSTTAAIWGAVDPSGAVANRVTAMANPERIRFMGQTSNPRAALSASGIFFYPLQPEHYGTAENALVEAMSLGLVPVVLANPAERAIVEHGVTGLVCRKAAECRAGLERLLDDGAFRTKLGGAAARIAAERYRPERSVAAFGSLWQEVASQPKRRHDFPAAIGHTPLDWYRSTRAGGAVEKGRAASKGTLAHFRASFPDDPCWDQIA